MINFLRKFLENILSELQSETNSYKTITILHNNDSESEIVNKQKKWGGYLGFYNTVENQKNLEKNTLFLNSGDVILPGITLSKSVNDVKKGEKFGEAILTSHLNYDAICLGNHDFDLGPETLAIFIKDAQKPNKTQFLSCNLDFSNEPSLQELVEKNLIKKSTIIKKKIDNSVITIGVIGATTELLPSLTSIGKVKVLPVVESVNNEIRILKKKKCDLIILTSHLQGITSEIELTKILEKGVDLILGGGGDELLLNKNSQAIPGDKKSILPGIEVNYPIENSITNFIPVATAPGSYRYLGKIQLNKTKNNKWLVDKDVSKVIPVNYSTKSNNDEVNEIVEKTNNYLEEIINKKIGEAYTDKTLVGKNKDITRSRPTILGNIIADAYKNAYQQKTNDNYVISIVNSGSIRNDLTKGDITIGSIYSVTPFSNNLSIIKNVSMRDLKILLEHGVSGIKNINGEPIRSGGGTGKFPQISGFKFIYNINGTRLKLGKEGIIIQNGNRVDSIILDNGERLVRDGKILDTNKKVDIITTSFTANGGDGYNLNYMSDGKGKSGRYLFTQINKINQQEIISYIENLSKTNKNLTEYKEYSENVEPRIRYIT